MRLSLGFIVVLLTTATTVGHALPWAPPSYRPDYTKEKQRVAYFQDNDPAGAAIIAVQISSQDGSLASSPARTPTGGKGLAGLIAISVDSVTVEDDLIFTTNAGDNTLSMLRIDPNDPMHPTLVGTPAPTLGDTPVSVAYSGRLNIACALNSGANAGAACFSVDRDEGLLPLGDLRSVPAPEVDPNNAAKPAPGPLTIAADIIFNPASTALFFSTGAVNAKAGHIYTYPVVVDDDDDNAQISMTPITSSFPSLPFLFSLNFLDDRSGGTRLITTNPIPNVPGAAFLDVQPDFSITYAQTITLPGQQAACWVADSPRHNTLYIADAALTSFSYINRSTGTVDGVVAFNGSAKTGGEDVAILRNRLYVLTDDQKTPKINVYDLGYDDDGKPEFVQGWDIFEELGGKIPGWMGLAVWPKV